MMPRMREMDRNNEIVLPAEVTSALSALGEKLPSDAMAALFGTLTEQQPWHARERRDLIERVRAGAASSGD
jgi:hypothetical protein